MNGLFIIYSAGAGVLLICVALLWLSFTRLTGIARRYNHSQSQYDEWESRIPEAARYDDLTLRLEDLEEEKKDLEADVADAKRWANELDTIAQNVEDAKQELLKVNAEREEQERLRISLESLRKEASDLSEQRRKAEEEAIAAKVQRENMATESEALAKRVSEHQAELDRLGREIGEQRNEQAKLNSEISGLRENASQLKRQADDLRHEISRLEDRVEKLSKQAAELKTEARDAEEQRDAARRELEKLERQKAQLESIVTQFRAEGAAGPEAAAADLWRPVIPTPDNAIDSEGDESSHLLAAEDYIKDCGLRFPRRVVHALHTCFKVAEESPLAVLTGISGTGKSELPRRYAEGMGMYFMPVAVQPRWDGPQDLFGFYNYLEKRFRPTELTRALLQFDRHDKDAERGWGSLDENAYDNLSDYMLVTLLDEMNLARVEYYFSELLSRLETRRGIDRKNRLKRRDAELTLEIGLATQGQDGDKADSLLRLLVDTNVLFAGTMNEDESTQSLSDKVVDRANLMRFGKPHELIKGKSAALESAFRPRLRYDRWQTWLTTDLADGPTADNVGKWTKRINERLDPVGRAFGHRMARAMRAYVANYPEVAGNADERTKWAMSDQIEMRILPRLRGLELHDSNVQKLLKEVQSLTRDELGDESLAQAIAQRTSPALHQFTWTGFDRPLDD